MLSLIVSDRIRAEMMSGEQRQESSVAAQIAICTFLAGGTIEALSQTLGLSHSATVRVVDGLVARGIVERQTSADRRATALKPTRLGRRQTEALLRARQHALDGVLAALTEPERRVLTNLHERIIFALMAGGGQPRRVCRMCDMHGCGHGEGTCPVTNGALARRLAEGTDG